MPTYKDIIAEQVFYFKNESFASLTIVKGEGRGIGKVSCGPFGRLGSRTMERLAGGAEQGKWLYYVW